MTQKNKLFILTREQQEFYGKVKNLDLPNLEIFAPENDNEAEIQKQVSECNIFLANPPLIKKHLNSAKNLKWLQSTFTGIDSLIEPNIKQDYLLTNVKDTFGEIMAEYVLSYILMFEKRTLENLTAQRDKVWDAMPYTRLNTKTVGIMGTGSIGVEIARSLKFFGITVFGLSASGNLKEHFDNVYSNENINEFLKGSDYIVSVLPNTKETTNLVDKKFLSMLKTNAVFINVGRGNAVVEEDLIEAVNSKTIKACVLEVFKEEPLPTNSLLWSTPNIFITPHVSGYYNSDRIFVIFRDNYLKFISGEKLEFVVDFEKGY